MSIPIKQLIGEDELTTRQVADLRRMYPNHCMVVIERAPKCKTLPLIRKPKKIMEYATTVGEFKSRIQRELKLLPSQTFMIMIDNQIPSNFDMMGRLHEIHKQPNGIMRVVYCEESFFG
ncbi:hypothetical protein M3Y94_01109600 [Aphelenchoides besseyi]|nr:hypothetical protein M3Y94_01109600 [Aphelenchoides besseyi]KAI6221531.1 hypothetical protein M3Y95_00971700 [Aphelenchoides besseyi]